MIDRYEILDHAELLHTDCIDWMKSEIRMGNTCLFDMIFADPPYFGSSGGVTGVGGKMVSNIKGDWDKPLGFEEELKFTHRWLSLCQQMLTKDGTIWVTGNHMNIHMVGFVMKKLGMHILNHITWCKPNPPPNMGCRVFTHSTETILWASKTPESKYTFNYELMKYVNGGRQMKDVWKFAPPRKTPTNPERHPTQKPIELPQRCILASTNPDDMVFDPFMGSGTTGIAALAHGRFFTGCEKDGLCFNAAAMRMENRQVLSDEQRKALG